MKKKARYLMERIGEINMATKQEGFRNFDLKNLDLEFQIKKNRKIRESEMDRERNNNRVLVRIIEKK